ncbi:MAG: ABC transporter ATP-binding protein/permease [Lachnospiraceae bacterium]|nr:ABC transporter ATP-binding protein/permease [Lachnospiraceae bacterium]
MSGKSKKTIQRGSFQRLLKIFFLKYKMLTFLMLFSIVVSAIATALGPQYLGYATDSVVQDMQNPVSSNIHWDRFFYWTAISAGIFLVQFVSKWLSGWFSTRIISDTARELRSQVEDKLWTLPLNYFDTNSHGDIMSRTTNDIDNVVTTLNSSGADTIYSIFQLVGMLVMMLAIDWRLALITVVIIPVSGWVVTLISKFVRKEYKKQWYYTGMINGNVEESVNGHNIIKLYGQEEKFTEKFKEQNRHLYEASFRAMAVSNLIQPLSRFFTNLNYVIVALGGAMRVLSGQMTVGDVQAFIQYTRQFQTPFSKLSQAYSSLQSGIASLDRIYELLDSENEIAEKKDAETDYRLKGKIAFRDVSFSYVPEKKLIEHMNLTVEPGKMVAIVGGTGAGKTTLVNLIERFYEVNDGRIVFDDRMEIRDLTRGCLRKNIAMVLQDTWVYKGTIEENLKYGLKEEITDEEFKEACRETFVDQFVSTLPEGYQTVISNELSSLSAGEKQLLTICRAFLVKPNILILDEATSSVDTRTEAMIDQALDKLREGRTSFVIAHRLSTIRNADVILVMENGHIVEQGNHRELIGAQGAYARLYQAQFEA